MEDNIQKCKGDWFINNKSKTWSYRYFYPQDFGCRLFEITKDNKIVTTNILDSSMNILSIEEFKKNYKDIIFFNILYYKVQFPNVGIYYSN